MEDALSNPRIHKNIALYSLYKTLECIKVGTNESLVAFRVAVKSLL